ncbi:hypothetical protein ON010_g15256 [Phytophthora cinnamomi]|nr:hypothetical protein ON010_g15256 [Phytophthora cinnamomi]
MPVPQWVIFKSFCNSFCSSQVSRYDIYVKAVSTFDLLTHTRDTKASMRLSSTGLAVIVATCYANGIARSTAEPTPAIVSGELQNALHFHGEILHDDKRFLRAPIAAGHEDEDEREDRSLLSWITSDLSGGAEKLRRREVKKLINDVVKNPVFYNELVMADATKLAQTYATWKALGVKPRYLAQSMTNAGFGGDEYKRFAKGYVDFLKSDIQIQ